MPGTPNPSMGMENYNDTPMINGTAYPKLTVQPKSYRFRILNAANDRFFNLQMYVADGLVTTTVANTEVKMIPAARPQRPSPCGVFRFYNSQGPPLLHRFNRPRRTRHAELAARPTSTRAWPTR